MKDRIYIGEIFRSIDGEVNEFYQGRITTFVRFSGCNCFCKYCDAKHFQAISNGKQMHYKDVAKQIIELGGDNLTITGGEPLMQAKGLKKLLKELAKEKVFNVAIETNGSITIPDGELDQRHNYSYVVDYKLTPGEDSHMLKKNWNKLTCLDFVKMVVDEDLLEKAIEIYHEIREVNTNVNIAFSPMFNKNGSMGKLTVEKLVDRLEANGIYDAIINIQMHKQVNMK